METTIENSWITGYILKKTEYWKCNKCGTLQVYAPFNMNYCSHCGEIKFYIIPAITKEVLE